MSIPSRYLRLRTVPGRVRALTVLVLVVLAVLFAVTGGALLDARSALRAVGHDEGPMVVATSDVYLALSDMDAQVTNVLLNGEENGWLCDPDQDGGACGRSGSRYFYDIRREDAERAALQAARLAEDDPVRLRTVQSVLDGLHQYDQRVQTAMERGRHVSHAFGALPEDAVEEYRAATTLMTEDLLPKANNLTLGGAAIVDTTYREERSGVMAGRIRVLVFGAAVLLALAALQLYLAVRFRRMMSLFLVAAAVGTVALTAVSATVLANEGVYLKVAKDGGFDPVLTLSRAQAIGKSLDSDRTRYLLDPSDSDRYDQTYLEKAQTILYINDAANLEGYYAKLDALLGRYDGGAGAVAFRGVYGDQAREATEVRGQRRTYAALLERYRAYQRNDRRVRALADAGDRAEAGRAHMDPRWPYLPHPAFREHDEELGARIGSHQYVVDRAVARGEGALGPWSWLLPLSVLAIAALVVAGVWPRLSEYR
ncbi:MULTISPECIES: hypothetical protein [Actinomadura]|uniref:Secreted protein n=1 Tax=Actinomadura yumaensis TaxID=111807 RepID=A0ABW2CJ43_9ACTN|nr:hypothetical protein [Actinomadura sp. J1-007]MWK40650.1 hypothetical protein [Actinomadura sp. J1-007]